jgi:hypothetical protein
MPRVKGVRWVLAADGTHDHIAGVCTAEDVYFSRDDVVNRIEQGEQWWFGSDGTRARIRTARTCPSPGCGASSYITTDSADTSTYTLENLPVC